MSNYDSGNFFNSRFYIVELSLSIFNFKLLFYAKIFFNFKLNCYESQTDYYIYKFVSG